MQFSDDVRREAASRAKRHVPGVLFALYMLCIMTPADHSLDRLSPRAAGLSNCRCVEDSVWLLDADLLPHTAKTTTKHYTTCLLYTSDAADE